MLNFEYTLIDFRGILYLFLIVTSNAIGEQCDGSLNITVLQLFGKNGFFQRVIDTRKTFYRKRLFWFNIETYVYNRQTITNCFHPTYPIKKNPINTIAKLLHAHTVDCFFRTRKIDVRQCFRAGRNFQINIHAKRARG